GGPDETRLAVERSGGGASAPRGRDAGRFLDGQSRRKGPDGSRQVHRILGIGRGGLQRVSEVTSSTYRNFRPVPTVLSFRSCRFPNGKSPGREIGCLAGHAHPARAAHVGGAWSPPRVWDCATD